MSPTADKTLLCVMDSCLRESSARWNATNEPNSNSQALVGKRKNAAIGLLNAPHSAKNKLTTAIANNTGTISFRFQRHIKSSKIGKNT